MAIGANDLNETVSNTNSSELVNGLTAKAGDVTAKVNTLIGQGTDALREQVRVVREQGVQGVTNDVVGYAKREPMKALLLAGGIGALAALILRRR